MPGISSFGAQCGFSCMPACYAASNDDDELIVSEFPKPTSDEAAVSEIRRHEAVDFESPVLGYAAAQKGSSGKNLEPENGMAFGRLKNWADETDDNEFILADFDGLSTACESSTEASDNCSVASSDGELGPEDLVVVGHGLLGSSASVSSLATSDIAEPILASSEAKQATWWSATDAAGVKGLEKAAQLATLLDARVIKRQKSSRAPAPWEPGQSSALYTGMGMADPSKSYLAVWLNLGGASLLFVLELADSKWMKTCVEDNFLSHRLKFISNPVQMRGALPSKAPKDAEAVGAFFGKRSTCSSQGMTDNGVPYVCIQVDVFSKWFVKVAFQQVALRLGNILELLLVDGESIGVLAGCRLTMTPELLGLLAA